MKSLIFLFGLISSVNLLAQNHTSKPIRYIFESIHDHMGNLDLNSKKVMLFSEDNRLLYEADFYEGEELDEQFFSYNADKKLTRDRRIFHKKEECGDYRMTYDESGNLISEKNVNSKGKVLEQKTMTYDKSANMISHVVEFYHESSDKMIVESSFKFTYEGNVLKSKTGFEDEKEDQIVSYKYEHTSDSETISRFDQNDKISEKWMTKMDSDGKLLQDVHTKYQDGKSIAKTVDFTYDQYGHILTETLTKTGSSIKKVINFEYKYDEFGNWIERKEFKKSGARESQGAHLKRHIEYFEKTDYNHPPMEMDESYNYETRDGKRVKVFQETHVRINNNQGELEWVVRRNGPDVFQLDEYEYEGGRLIRINHLNNEKSGNAYTLVRYNDEGKASEESSYGSNGDMNDKIIYAYGKDRKLASKEEIEKGKSILTEKYTYDSKSAKVIKSDIVEFEDKTEVTYEYDDNGFLAKTIEVPNGKVAEQTVSQFVYAKGILLKELDFEGKSKKASEEVRYTYENGEISKRAIYRGKEIHSEIDFTYFE